MTEHLLTRWLAVGQKPRKGLGEIEKAETAAFGGPEQVPDTVKH